MIEILPTFFSPEFHRLISRVALEGRWASQDVTMYVHVRFAYAITSNNTFFTISKPSFLLSTSVAMISDAMNPVRKSKEGLHKPPGHVLGADLIA
ncbi:hypothetical protein [Aquabacterium sp.]|uniref:hypothetical protein n=1 Tax=Aquabacterium sp. TaxID=1872578 RepID=UPI003BAEE9A5